MEVDQNNAEDQEENGINQEIGDEKENKKDNEEKKDNISSPDSEIKKLKEEINYLKDLHKKDQLEIQEIKKKFQTEIDSLKAKFKLLNDQFDEMKKNKKANNIIINESDEEMEDNTYSVECLTSKKDTEILQGAEKTNINIVIKNNSKKKYPKNAYLVSDNKNSLLLCEKVKLNELEPNQQQNVSILFNNLKYISKGTYNCIVKLQIDNKIYNSSFELKVKVIDSHLFDNQNPQRPNYQQNIAFQPGGSSEIQNQGSSDNIQKKIMDFRVQFGVYDEMVVPDEKIENALIRANFDFNQAFQSLYD